MSIGCWLERCHVFNLLPGRVESARLYLCIVGLWIGVLEVPVVSVICLSLSSTLWRKPAKDVSSVGGFPPLFFPYVLAGVVKILYMLCLLHAFMAMKVSGIGVGERVMVMMIFMTTSAY